MNNKQKSQLTNKLLIFFLKCHNGIKIKKSEKETHIKNFKKWKRIETNISLTKEINRYLKMLEKVQLNQGMLDYEIRNLKYLNDFLKTTK